MVEAGGGWRNLQKAKVAAQHRIKVSLMSWPALDVAVGDAHETSGRRHWSSLPRN